MTRVSIHDSAAIDSQKKEALAEQVIYKNAFCTEAVRLVWPFWELFKTWPCEFGPYISS